MKPGREQGTEESLLRREPGTVERGLRPPKEALLAAIVETSADAIIGWTLEGAIFSWNGGAEKLFGYSSAEAVGQISPSSFRPNVSLRSRVFAKNRSG